MKNPRIGFIGLGIMGRPMAQNLLKAGFQVTVYNRTEPPVELLLSAGASRSPSPRAVAERSDVVITMVTDSEAVREVVLGSGGVIEGAHGGLTLIDMSTIAPSMTRKVSTSLAAKGVKMLDAPVSGGEGGAREGSLTIMVGGDIDVFQECLPVLQAMGKRVAHFGPSGSGQLTKLANQILVACNMVGVSECLNFAKKAGLDLGRVIDSLSGGAASSWSLVNLGPRMARRDFAPGFKVKLLQKDLRYVLETAAELDAPLPATALVHGLYSQLEEEGLGDVGTQALLMAIEQMSSRG
ncbi:MAG TPA: NAD(P)-dependent oxidoreductase [Nitrososphaerales archaeon]|nr:NAD(P)-dependent oxidoreductase [Nitrososphaerales archaeon]